MGRAKADMIGKRFGRLLVLSQNAPGMKNKHAKWNCICDCGNTKVASTGNLTQGMVTSCGCLHHEVVKDRKGSKNNNWRGGLSFGKYCYKFNEELKEYIRVKFNRKCYICGTEENGYKLSIHHVDYNKLQGCKGQQWVLIPLCRKCHSKTNGNRWYWFNRLINYWADKYTPEVVTW
jgi:hypothetical protein